MDTIKTSMEELNKSIQRRMEEFEAKLLKSSSSPINITTLAGEFSAYRLMIADAIKLLQQQVNSLAHSVDSIEMQRRRKILLFHGVEEKNEEDVLHTVTNIIKLKVGISDISTGDIKRCQRLGRSTSPKKPRPILCKLDDVAIRDKLWFTKTKLRGSGITISEFLTKTRHDVFMAAREKFGVTKSWTRDGSVYILGPDGVRHRVVTMMELDKIADLVPKPCIASKTVSLKSKRSAAVKK